MDDTTTIRIFDKLDAISVDVGVIKDKMPYLATRDHVDLKIAAHAALPSRPPKSSGKISGKLIAAIITAVVALSGAVAALAQAI